MLRGGGTATELNAVRMPQPTRLLLICAESSARHTCTFCVCLLSRSEPCFVTLVLELIPGSSFCPEKQQNGNLINSNRCANDVLYSYGGFFANTTELMKESADM